MPLCSKAEEDSLRNWNFIRDHQNCKPELIGFARAVYQIVKQTLNPSNPSLPQPDQCEDGVMTALRGSPGFGKILRSKPSIASHYHDYFLRAMARYLLDKYWGDIKQ
jgi:hypothetical protein